MSWAFLALCILGALLTANALRPPRMSRLAGVTFPLGWLVSELAVHVVVLQLIGTAAFAAGGAFDGAAAPAAFAGLVLAVLSWCGLVVLAVSGARARRVFDEVLPAAEPPQPPPAPAPASLLRLARAYPARPRCVERIHNVDYAGDGKRYHRLDLFRRRDAGDDGSPRPVLLYLHGGAWMIGDKREQGLPMMHHLAEQGAVCFTANYRLSPRATWPAHLDDCRQALEWVREHAAGYGGDPGRIVLAGGSAGGHLASLLALSPAGPPVAGCISLYGVYDFTDAETGHPPQLLRLLERNVMKQLRVEQAEIYAEASPRSHVHADAPPFLVVHGRNDTLVPVSTARAFVAALREVSKVPVAYVELPFAQHAYDLFWSARTAATAAAAEAFLFARTSTAPQP